MPSSPLSVQRSKNLHIILCVRERHFIPVLHDEVQHFDIADLLDIVDVAKLRFGEVALHVGPEGIATVRIFSCVFVVGLSKSHRVVKLQTVVLDLDSECRPAIRPILWIIGIC